MTRSETAVQKHAQLVASQSGDRLWRNNVGVMRDDKGRPIRYGLANESAEQNSVLKSSDLIGITQVLITPDMVGTVVGVFTAAECKKTSWRPGEDVKRETAQQNYHDLVRSLGGRAGFVKNADGPLVIHRIVGGGLVSV